MPNAVLFNTSGSIALAVNYVLQGPYTNKFMTRQDSKTIRINAEFYVRVDQAVLIFDTDVDIDESELDAGVAYDGSTTYYIYACHPLDGSGVPVLRISQNATYPAGGWSASNSRQLGGFDTDGSGDIAAAGNGLWDLRTVDVTHTGVTDAEIPADEISFSKLKQAEIFARDASTFNGQSGRTLAHNIGNTNYHVVIEPTATPQGLLGEVYFTKSANDVVVYNSGSAVTAFAYLIIKY